MKKSLVVILVISSIFMMGCNSNEGIGSNSDNEKVSEIRDQDNKNSDKYILLHENMIDDIRAIYEKRNLEYDEEMIDTKDFSGTYELYFNKSQANTNEISYANYGITVNDKNEVDSLAAVVAEKVSEEELKNNDYTIDGTIFEDFAKVMVKNSEYKNDVEQAVNDYFKNNGKNIVFLEYDDVDINLL